MEPAGVSAVTVGVTYSLSDAQNPASGTAPVIKPSATGTAYSWILLVALKVTGTAATAITNRKIAFATVVASGSAVFFADQPTYREPATGNHPTSSGSNGPATPTPAGASAPGSYAAVTTSAALWDATSHSTGSLGRNGDFIELLGAIDHTSSQGSGQDALPDLDLTFDES